MRIRQLVNTRLNGGALYISIMVSVVIGILLLMLLLLSRYNSVSIANIEQDSQLRSNLKSAFEIAKSQYFNESLNGRWIKNEFNDDSVFIRVRPWGAYNYISVKTKNRHSLLMEAGLFGTFMSSDTGLVVSDNTRSTGLSGSIDFNANCYLPSGGIKPAFIEGQSFIASPNMQSHIRKSPLQIPAPDGKFLENINSQLHSNSQDDSLVYELAEKLDWPFSNATLVYEANGRTLTHKLLKGNIIIRSRDELIIDSTCSFDNVLLIARKVVFKNGFTGKVHVVASDSIICGKATQFLFPSSLVVFNDEMNESGLKSIEFGEGSRFYGGVVAYSESRRNGDGAFIKLSGTSEVNGLVYSSGYLHVQGKLNANVFADKLLIKTPSAVYENHILSCELNPAKYAGLISVPMVLRRNAEWKRCEKV